jgi:hypothetical protein
LVNAADRGEAAIESPCTKAGLFLLSQPLDIRKKRFKVDFVKTRFGSATFGSTRAGESFLYLFYIATAA